MEILFSLFGFLLGAFVTWILISVRRIEEPLKDKTMILTPDNKEVKQNHIPPNGTLTVSSWMKVTVCNNPSCDHTGDYWEFSPYSPCPLCGNSRTQRIGQFRVLSNRMWGWYLR